MLLILKLEGERFTWYKQKAWERDEILTNRGLELMEEAFSNVNIMEYRINVTACDSFHRVTVRRTTSKMNMQLLYQWSQMRTGVDLEVAHAVSRRQMESHAGTWLSLQCHLKSMA